MADKKKMLKQKAQDKKNDEKTAFDIVTEIGLFSETINSVVQHKFSNTFGNRSFGSIHDHLEMEGKKVTNGNLESAERMLIVHAHTLDVIFNNLAYRAAVQDNLEVFESLIRLAFKAQSQCRSTLETLANIKNPPHVAFVKQANIGHNQQVNNTGSPAAVATRKRKKNRQNQLLEDHYEKRMDIGTQSTTIKADKKLEAVGKINRTKDT